MYNLDFSITGLLFDIIMVLYLQLQYPIGSKSIQAFKRVAIVNTFFTLIDIISSVVPIGYMLHASTVYFVLEGLLIYCFVHYINVVIGSQSRNKIRALIFETIPMVFYMSCLVLNYPLKILFYVNLEENAYCRGPLNIIVNIVPFYYFIYVLIKIIKYRTHFTLKQIVSSILFVVIVIVGMLLQAFFLPNVLLCTISCSLALFIMMVSLETPDYVKLQKTMDELEKAKEEAQLANIAKSRFLANMSHEIRTPINAVLGFDTMILRESKEEAVKEYAIDIQNAGQSLLSLVNDILDLSKIESGKMEIVEAEYSFRGLVNDVVNMIGMKANAKGLKVEMDVDRNLPSILFGDDVRIRQILINIMNNAVKYTEKGSVSLKIGGEVKNGIVVLNFRIKDTGVGIKDEDLEKLFSAYERINENKNRSIEGTGLGMSITSQLLALMGSKLEVQSVYGHGSEFYFDLAQKVVDASPVGDIKEQVKEQAKQYTYKNSFTTPDAKILVVDDTKMNRKLFLGLLKNKQAIIDEAEDGYRAIERCKEKKYDLIFMDYMMPGMDGCETLHQLKKLPEALNADTPVIVLTANAITGAKEMYMEEGFDDFVSKPIIPERLEKALLEHLPENMIVPVTD